VKVLVVDDEPLARSRLLRMLERIPDVVAVGEAANGREALDRIRELAPDVVLLDVRMPGLDGLELARELVGPIRVIFTTAFDEYAVEAFEVSAADYLLKPIRLERLERALGRLRQSQAGADPRRLRELFERLVEAAPPARATRITARRGDSLRVFDPTQIERFTAADGYVAFRHGGGEFLLEESLHSLEQRLAPLGFLRIHRSELIRLDAVQALHSEDGNTSVELADGARAPVSRRLVAELKRRLGI